MDEGQRQRTRSTVARTHESAAARSHEAAVARTHEAAAARKSDANTRHVVVGTQGGA